MRPTQAMLTSVDFPQEPRSSAHTRIKSSLSPEHGRHFWPGPDWRFARARVAIAATKLEGACVGALTPVGGKRPQVLSHRFLGRDRGGLGEPYLRLVHAYWRDAPTCRRARSGGC